MVRSVNRCASLLIFSFVFALLASGQERVTGGPPPEIRSDIEVSSSPELAWSFGMPHPSASP